MQPENNMQNMESMGGGVSQESMMVQEVPGNNSVLSEKKNKMSKKQIIGLVVLSLIALGGVLFGVYGMNSQNEQIADLKVQVSDASGKLAQLETEKITITDADGTTTEIADSATVSSFQNPVIKASDDSSYSVMYNMPVYAQDSNTSANMQFFITNGQFDSCYVANVADGCSVSGLPEGAYKMATIYEGNGIGSEKIGFLMNDGTVYYATIYSGADASLSVNTNLVVKKANIDGFVKDIVRINYCSGTTKYCNASTVFVMSDNSLVKYDESMFE